MIDNIPWALTKGEQKALCHMPLFDLVAAERGSPFNGRCMWQLCLKGYVESPDAGASPTLYRMTEKARRYVERPY